jgi:hypothetical protein
MTICSKVGTSGVGVGVRLGAGETVSVGGWGWKGVSVAEDTVGTITTGEGVTVGFAQEARIKAKSKMICKRFISYLQKL